MNKTSAWLIGLLILSNVAWAYRAFDAGVSSTYREDAYDLNRSAMDDAINMVLRCAQGSCERDDLIHAASKRSGFSPVEVNGWVTTGSLRLRFDGTNELKEIRPTQP